jgi:flagellar biosynthesis GTPase FlhF
MNAMIEHVVNVVTARLPIQHQRRCGHCNAVGHDRRTCATRFREVEERAIGHPVPIVHADNKEELKRLRALSATRLLEEAVQERAQALQESENRARERAEARQARERDAQEARNAATAVAVAGAMARVRQQAEEHAEEMRRLGVEEQRARQALQNAMQQVHQPPLRATENELARMVALPVLREKPVEATECPICIEDLGEVGKTVLKCGHTVCVSCFLQQMMRATAETRARECACPVCRVSYIM